MNPTPKTLPVIEIVICTDCQGFGYTTRHETTDYHRGEYDVIRTLCRTCDGHGRLKRTTKWEFEKLKPLSLEVEA